jgi:hypothetical protein
MAVFTVLNADATKTSSAGAPAGTVVVAAMAGTTPDNVNRRPNLVVVGASIAGIAIAAAISWWLWDVVVEPSDFVPRSDYTALAGVIFIATAIERLLEPVSRYLVPAEEQERKADASKAQAVNQAADRDVTEAEMKVHANDAAEAISKLRRRKSERAIAFWAISTSIAMLFAAISGVFFLRVVSSSTTTNRFVDLLLTGLIVGGGTKPTHDLISMLEASKNKTKTDPVTASE